MVWCKSVVTLLHVSITIGTLVISKTGASALMVLPPERSAPICEQLSTFSSAVSNTTASFPGVEFSCEFEDAGLLPTPAVHRFKIILHDLVDPRRFLLQGYPRCSKKFLLSNRK